MLQLIKKYTDSYLCKHDHNKIDPQNALYLNTAYGQIDGCCCLFFGEDKDFPLLVAKGAFTPKGKAVFEIEFGTLQKLQQIGMNTLGQTTPTPLGLWHEEGALITLQSALPGTVMKYIPAKLLFSPERISKTVDKVLQWWYKLQESFGVRRVKLTGKVYNKEILSPLKRFQQRFLLNNGEISFLNRRYLVEKPLLGVELPFGVRHDDFCAGNIVYQSQGIGVIDWGFQLNHQLPLFDLFFFFSSVRFPFKGFRGESSHFDSFINVFWGDNYFSKAMRDCIQQVCAKFKIPPEIIPDLFLTSLIGIANMTYDGSIKSHENDAERRDGDQVSDGESSLRWQSFWVCEKDVPFALVRNGVFENIRFIVQHGLPDFKG